jgi:hypothetical protein
LARSLLGLKNALVAGYAQIQTWNVKIREWKESYKQEASYRYYVGRKEASRWWKKGVSIMGAEVNSQQFQGLDVDHPRIREAIETAAKRGYDKDKIQKVIGMPYEVVDRGVREAKRKSKKK